MENNEIERCPICCYTEQDAKELMDHRHCKNYGFFSWEPKTSTDLKGRDPVGTRPEVPLPESSSTL